MTARPIDLARVRAARARLDELEREHPEAFADVPRLVAALASVGPTGHEAAAVAREAFAELAREKPEVVTLEVRETFDRAIDAIEAFDDDSEET